MKKHELSTDVNEYNFILKKIFLDILCHATPLLRVCVVHNQHLLNKKNFLPIISLNSSHRTKKFFSKSINKMVKGECEKRRKTETEKSIAEKIFFSLFLRPPPSPPSSQLLVQYKRKTKRAKTWCSVCLCVHIKTAFLMEWEAAARWEKKTLFDWRRREDVERFSIRNTLRIVLFIFCSCALTVN